MNKFLLLLKAILYISLGIIILVRCESEYQESLYNPDAPKGSIPEITSVSPPDGALAGVGEVTITGNNFSSNRDEVMVFFDAESAQILEASPTQLVVLAPNIFGDSIKIKIAVHKVELFSNTVIYKLKPAVNEIGNLLDEDIAYGIAIDVAGDLYLSISSKTIKKVASTGLTTIFTPKTTFLKANQMKMGPDNTIYAAVAAGRIRKIVAIDANGNESTFVTLPANPYDLDFDVNGNIWVAVMGDVYLVKMDKSKAKIASFPVTLTSLRVFNGYVYVTGKNPGTMESKIWRAQIQDETLGAAEEVLDLAGATWLENANVLCLTFTADGDMLLGTDHANGIFVYRETDASHEILYPGLIEPNIYSMSWDEGHYLYAVRQFEGEDGSTSKILRIDMDKGGAPYYGRK